MNDMRKLIESVERIEEGYFSRLSVDLDELYRSNPNTPDENLIAFVRRKHGDKAADFFRSQIESGEYEQSLGEGYGEETFDEMVDYWKQSLSSSIVSKGVFTQLYDAANNNIDELNSAIADQAYSIAESYHGSGEGIGTSDQNHFIMHIGQSLGIDDLFGWNKPKDSHPKDANWPHASDEDMDRDKANRGSRFKNIGEENSDSHVPQYENPEQWEGQQVRVTGGQYEGVTGEVQDVLVYHSDEGVKESEFTVNLKSGQQIVLYPSEFGHDQLELARDKDEEDFMYSNPFESIKEDESGVDEVVKEWMDRFDKL